MCIRLRLLDRLCTQWIVVHRYPMRRGAMEWDACRPVTRCCRYIVCSAHYQSDGPMTNVPGTLHPCIVSRYSGADREIPSIPSPWCSSRHVAGTYRLLATPLKEESCHVLNNNHVVFWSSSKKMRRGSGLESKHAIQGSLAVRLVSMADGEEQADPLSATNPFVRKRKNKLSDNRTSQNGSGCL